MKKMLIVAVFALVCFEGALFAQQNASTYKESEYYYHNIPIEKIYAYKLGYIVLYRKGVNGMARTFLPADWFTDIGGKGELVAMGSGSEWPSMTVYYKSGAFSHVRLRVRRVRSHESWGVVPLNVNIDEYFQDIEEIKLEF